MIKVVSLFAGLGGFDLGLYAAAEALGLPVKVVAAYDSMPCSVACYNANLPHPVAQVRDLKTMERHELPPHDLVIGGPPCQPFSLAGKRKGHDDDRNCLPDFLRLAGDGPYVMENVVSRLINAPWSERLCAANFGDVTSRKRWFYSNYLLHVVPTPGPRRIRDIRDHDEDHRVIQKRSGCVGVGNGTHGHYSDKELVGSLTAHTWHGLDTRAGKTLPIAIQSGHKNVEQADDGVFPSIVGQAHRSQSKRGASMLKLGLPDSGILGTLTAGPHGMSGAGQGHPNALRLGLRGNSASASASAFEDDEILGSVLSNSFHANEASKLVGCRNPSLLEMARAHSIPDSFDWQGATKTQRGQMIANSIPVGLATAVCRAILEALAREKGLAA